MIFTFFLQKFTASQTLDAHPHCSNTVDGQTKEEQNSCESNFLLNFRINSKFIRRCYYLLRTTQSISFGYRENRNRNHAKVMNRAFVRFTDDRLVTLIIIYPLMTRV